MATVIQPFPELPVDIVRSVFETAASTRQAEAAILLRVSRLVHDWIKPVAYRRIYLIGPTAFQFFASSLAIQRTLSQNQASDSVQTLSIYLGRQSSYIIDYLSDLPITSLTRLTHLTILASSLALRSTAYFQSAIDTLKRLTHLGVVLNDSQTDMYMVIKPLSSLPASLRVCVLRYAYDSRWPLSAHANAVGIVASGSDTSLGPAERLKNIDYRIVFAHAGDRVYPALRRIALLSNMIKIRCCNAGHGESLLGFEDEIWELADELVTQRENDMGIHRTDDEGEIS